MKKSRFDHNPMYLKIRIILAFLNLSELSCLCRQSGQLFTGSDVLIYSTHCLKFLIVIAEVSLFELSTQTTKDSSMLKKISFFCQQVIQKYVTYSVL